MTSGARNRALDAIGGVRGRSPRLFRRLCVNWGCFYPFEGSVHAKPLHGRVREGPNVSLFHISHPFVFRCFVDPMPTRAVLVCPVCSRELLLLAKRVSKRREAVLPLRPFASRIAPCSSGSPSVALSVCITITSRITAVRRITGISRACTINLCVKTRIIAVRGVTMPRLSVLVLRIGSYVITLIMSPCVTWTGRIRLLQLPLIALSLIIVGTPRSVVIFKMLLIVTTVSIATSMRVAFALRLLPLLIRFVAVPRLHVLTTNLLLGVFMDRCALWSSPCASSSCSPSCSPTWYPSWQG